MIIFVHIHVLVQAFEWPRVRCQDELHALAVTVS